tara:strand:- start:203 stop:481 length:279 start_codon:yes stop_codon:yes gene_type:complete
MSINKHDVIRQLYSDVVFILDNAGTFSAKDKDGKAVTIDMSAVNTEFNKQNYKNQREDEYPSVVDQLDDIYHNGIDAWKATIKATKDKYPKS